MKKSFKKYEVAGLPGGPNELKRFTNGFIISERGQWDYPGQPTAVPTPTGKITMQGVKNNLVGIDNLGNMQYMTPGNDYQFEGDIVYEIPQAKRGGSKKPSKKYSRSLMAKNRLFTKNHLFEKRKHPKNKIFDPYSPYFQDGGEAGCPEGYYYDPTQGCIPNDEHQNWLKDWYTNRIMDSPEGQEILKKVQPEVLKRAENFPPYLMTEELPENTPAAYDLEKNVVMLNKFLPKKILEESKTHEDAHYLTSGDKFLNLFDKQIGYVVNNNIIDNPKKINTGNEQWDKELRKNFDYVVSPEEMYAKVMTLRKDAGFDPAKPVTLQDLEDYFTKVKESGSSLNPDIEELKAVTKDKQAIVNLLNDLVSVPGQTEDLTYAKDGGEIELELDEKEIDKYVKGGYIVEDISVPSLSRMDGGGEKRRRKNKNKDKEYETVTSDKKAPESTYTPIDPNYLAANPDTYSQIVNKPEVSTERQASDIGKLRAEYRDKNPMDIFLDEKKRKYLKKNKGLNKAAGVTMENFPEDVLQNFINEYNYKTNNYAVNKLGKKEGWDPKRRGEWVDELTPGEKDAVAESKYGSKLQPSYWSRSLAGLQELGNAAIKLLPGEQGDVLKYNIPGLTKREQKEIAESKLGALETLAPMDIPGAAIANYIKNTGLTTGSDYKEQANALAGEKMANVSDIEAMALNPLTYAGAEAIPELGVNLVRGLGKGISMAPEALSGLRNFIGKEKPGTLELSNLIENSAVVPNQVAEASSVKNVPTPVIAPKELIDLAKSKGALPQNFSGELSVEEVVNLIKKQRETPSEIPSALSNNKVRNQVLESVPKDAPYLIPDEVSPNIKTFGARGQTITYNEGIDLLENMANKYPVLQESPRIPVYYHGTTSASLPGIIKNEGLMPTGQLLKEGKVPLTGELGAGVEGINNSSISTTTARGHKGALDYAIGLSGKNKINVEDDLANWFERGGRESFFESPYSPDISFYDDLKNKRLTEWQNLSDAEKALVQDNYPVMFGINPTKGNAERFTIPTTDISDEVGISGKINFEEIPSIFVPKSKVTELQQQLGTKTKVLPIEDFMVDYKNADTYNQMGYEKGGIVSELSQKEINNLIKQGYIIEEIKSPKARYKYSVRNLIRKDDGGSVSGTQGLTDDFSQRLTQMILDARSQGIDLGIGSGYRSYEQQKRLWEKALKKYGSPEKARKWVAPPGRSFHNKGLAVDLNSNGQFLGKEANSKATEWAHANAKKYGLHFRMGNEPWHIEPIEKSKSNSDKENEYDHSHEDVYGDRQKETTQEEYEQMIANKDLEFELKQKELEEKERKLNDDDYSNWEPSKKEIVDPRQEILDNYAKIIAPSNQNLFELYTANLQGQMKKGGFVMELTNKEIERYRKRGFIIEELD